MAEAFLGQSSDKSQSVKAAVMRFCNWDLNGLRYCFILQSMYFQVSGGILTAL